MKRTHSKLRIYRELSSRIHRVCAVVVFQLEPKMTKWYKSIKANLTLCVFIGILTFQSIRLGDGFSIQEVSFIVNLLLIIVAFIVGVFGKFKKVICFS